MRRLISALAAAALTVPLAASLTFSAPASADVTGGAYFYATPSAVTFDAQRETLTFALGGGTDFAGGDAYRYCSITLENAKTGDEADSTTIDETSDYGQMRLSIDSMGYAGGAGLYTLVADCANDSYAERNIAFRAASRTKVGYVEGGQQVGVTSRRYSNDGWGAGANTPVAIQRKTKSGWKTIGRARTNRAGFAAFPRPKGLWRGVTLRTPRTETSVKVAPRLR